MSIINRQLPSIKQLQCFLAVAEELSFRKAAERLRMTQPPLTRHIKCLEDILGCELLSRNTHKVHLTDAGAKLERKASALIEELSLLTNELAEVKTSLRIGLTKTLNFNNIPILYNKISELLSDDELAIQRLNSEQLLRSLSKGQMDIVITGEKSLCSTYNYDFHWLYREPLLLAMPSSYVDPLKAKVSLKEVGDLPLFWFSRKENPVFYDKCEGYFSKLPYSIKRVKEPEDSLVMLSAIALGKGMALMPASMCTFTQEGLTYKPLIDEAQKVLNIDVYAVVSKSEEREHVLEGLNSLIDKV